MCLKFLNRQNNRKSKRLFFAILLMDLGHAHFSSAGILKMIEKKPSVDLTTADQRKSGQLKANEAATAAEEIKKNPYLKLIKEVEDLVDENNLLKLDRLLLHEDRGAADLLNVALNRWMYHCLDGVVSLERFKMLQLLLAQEDFDINKSKFITSPLYPSGEHLTLVDFINRVLRRHAAGKQDVSIDTLLDYVLKLFPNPSLDVLARALQDSDSRVHGAGVLAILRDAAIRQSLLASINEYTDGNQVPVDLRRFIRGDFPRSLLEDWLYRAFLQTVYRYQYPVEISIARSGAEKRYGEKFFYYLNFNRLLGNEINRRFEAAGSDEAARNEAVNIALGLCDEILRVRMGAGTAMATVRAKELWIARLHALAEFASGDLFEFIIRNFESEASYPVLNSRTSEVASFSSRLRHIVFSPRLNTIQYPGRSLIEFLLDLEEFVIEEFSEPSVNDKNVALFLHLASLAIDRNDAHTTAILQALSRRAKDLLSNSNFRDRVIESLLSPRLEIPSADRARNFRHLATAWASDDQSELLESMIQYILRSYEPADFCRLGTRVCRFNGQIIPANFDLSRAAMRGLVEQDNYTLARRLLSVHREQNQDEEDPIQRNIFHTNDIDLALEYGGSRSFENAFNSLNSNHPERAVNFLNQDHSSRRNLLHQAIQNRRDAEFIQVLTTLLIDNRQPMQLIEDDSQGLTPIDMATNLFIREADSSALEAIAEAVQSREQLMNQDFNGLYRLIRRRISEILMLHEINLFHSFTPFRSVSTDHLLNRRPIRGALTRWAVNSEFARAEPTSRDIAVVVPTNVDLERDESAALAQSPGTSHEQRTVALEVTALPEIVTPSAPPQADQGLLLESLRRTDESTALVVPRTLQDALLLWNDPFIRPPGNPTRGSLINGIGYVHY